MNNSLKNLSIEMTARMNVVEEMDKQGFAPYQEDLDRISEIATMLKALAPNLLDPRF